MVNRRLSISGRPVSLRLFFFVFSLARLSYSRRYREMGCGFSFVPYGFARRHSKVSARCIGGGISSQDYSGGLPWRVIAALILLLDRLAGQETLSRNQIRRSSTGFRHRPECGENFVRFKLKSFQLFPRPKRQKKLGNT